MFAPLSSSNSTIPEAKIHQNLCIEHNNKVTLHGSTYLGVHGYKPREEVANRNNHVNERSLPVKKRKGKSL